MDAVEMGRVLTRARIESLEDLWACERGIITKEEIRSIVVDDAVVDTDSTFLSLPTKMLVELGLDRSQTKHVRERGHRQANLYAVVRLTINGRSCTMDVIGLPDMACVTIGRLALLHLDFVVDMRAHKLIGNPDHGGEHMYELY